MIYENVFFSLYGTLIEAKTDENQGFLWRVICDVYKRNSAKYEVEEFKKSFYRSIIDQKEGKDDGFEVDILKVFKKLYEEKGVKIKEEELLNTAKEFRRASTLSLSVYDGARECIRELKKLGKKIYLLADAQSCYCKYELESLNILEYFDDVFVSSDYGVKKPNERFFSVAFNKYRLKKENSVLVGNDEIGDIVGGRNFGIDTVYIKGADEKTESMPPATYIFSCRNFLAVTKILSI